jgi:hypothetical protein
MLQLQIFIFVPLFFLPAADVIIHPAHQQWKNEKAESENAARRLVQYVAASDRQLMEQTRLLLAVLSKSTPAMRQVRPGSTSQTGSIFSRPFEPASSFSAIMRSPAPPANIQSVSFTRGPVKPVSRKA